MLVNLNNLSFKYTLSNKNALTDVTMDIYQGDKILIIGKRGASKSTLLQMFKKNILPIGAYKGEINYILNDSEICYLPQNISATFLSKSVISNIVFSAENLGLEKLEIEKRLSEICTYLSISDILDKNIDELSGGQRQLVAIASCLITYPKMLLLDEPLSELSVNNRRKLIEILNILHEQTNMTIILCEHQINDCISFADKICLIDNGAIADFNYKDDVFKNLFKKDNDNLFIPDLTKLSLNLYDKIYYTPNKFNLNISNNSETQLNILSKNEILKIKNLTYFYNKNDKTILKDLNLSVLENEKLAILG